MNVFKSVLIIGIPKIFLILIFCLSAITDEYILGHDLAVDRKLVSRGRKCTDLRGVHLNTRLKEGIVNNKLSSGLGVKRTVSVNVLCVCAITYNGVDIDITVKSERCLTVKIYCKSVLHGVLAAVKSDLCLSRSRNNVTGIQISHIYVSCHKRGCVLYVNNSSCLTVVTCIPVVKSKATVLDLKL